MRVKREDIERELNLSDRERAAAVLRRTVADFGEIDRELRAAEKRAGLEVGPDIPVVDRMAKLGYSEEARRTVAEMIGALDDMRRRRKLSQRTKTMLADREAAILSANQQLAAILAARKSARPKR
jgi:hypothetical protein